jgi:hypothetical protein
MDPNSSTSTNSSKVFPVEWSNHDVIGTNTTTVASKSAIVGIKYFLANVYNCSSVVSNIGSPDGFELTA